MNTYWTGLKTYYTLSRNLRKPLEVLQSRQFRALCKLVGHAYRNVPFYRRFYEEAGFSPEQLRKPEDIERIPKTRKLLFQQANESELIADNLNQQQLVGKRTSGSTGSPLNVYYTPEDRIYRTILHLRILLHNGMSLRDRMAHISDSRHSADWRYGFQKLGFLSKNFVCAADPAERQLADLERIHPDVIYSYASSLVLLAQEVARRGKNSIHPKLVFTTGELLNSTDRQLVNEVFGVQVKDIYGVVEMGDVAWQCPALSGYHLNIDSFFAEIETDSGSALPGEAGRLILTNLHSMAMPFIRYEVGDVVTTIQPEACACGCTFPRIGVVQGRADDGLFTADGRRISPLIFVVASIPGVQQYRMIQKALDFLWIEIVPGAGFTLETLSQVADHVREVMGGGMRVEVRQISEIPKDPSGKMRRVVSEINT